MAAPSGEELVLVAESSASHDGSGSLKRVAAAIMTRRCVLFCGPAIPQGPSLQGGRTINCRIADNLVKQSNYPDRFNQDDSLAHVAQVYISEEPWRDRGDVLDAAEEIHQAYRDTTTEIHRQLAKLPFPVYVTTAQDSQLEMALREAGKSPIVSHFDFEKPEQEVPLAGKGLPAPSVERPLLYSLFGSIREPSSMVLTEDDIVDFMIKVCKGGKEGLPADLEGLLQDDERPFIFLGFGLDNWYFRILLRLIRKVSNRRTRKSFAYEFDQGIVKTGRFRRAKAFFELGYKIFIEVRPVETFVHSLVEECARLEPETPAPSKGKIFISYYHADGQRLRDTFQSMVQSLRDAGFDPWVDTESLHVGVDWEQNLTRALSEEAEYFLLFQTKETEDPARNRNAKFKSWFVREIRVALDLARDYRDGFRFIFPVKGEACEEAPELAKFQSIDISTEEGRDRLVLELKRECTLRVRSGGEQD